MPYRCSRLSSNIPERPLFQVGYYRLGSPPEVRIIDRTEKTDTQPLYAPTPAALPRSLSLRFIGIAVRRATKPACISALMQRARARAWPSAGHISGWRSARHAAMVMFSQTWKPPPRAGRQRRQAEFRPSCRSTAAGRPWQTPEGVHGTATPPYAI